MLEKQKVKKGILSILYEFLFGETTTNEKHEHDLKWGNPYKEKWFYHTSGIKLGDSFIRVFQYGRCKCGYVEKREILPNPDLKKYSIQ